MKKAIKIISITLVCIIAATLIAATVFFVKTVTSDNFVQFDEAKLNNFNNTVTILDQNGNKIEDCFYINGYKQVPIDSLNAYTPAAFVSIEDKRFYSHKGLDYKRIAGAVINNIKHGGFSEGASTISQQLIKNTHLDNKKTVQRKVNEVILAKQLENKFNKKKILEMYLNTIYFGSNAYGIESASNIFFGKSATDLTLSESAMLAGIIKSPANYSPISKYDNCIARRNIVLSTMLANDFINNTEYEQAVAERPQCNTEGMFGLEQNYTYGVMMQACELLNMSQLQLLNSHVTIETYYNPTLQQALKQAIENNNTTNTNGKKADALAIIADNKTGAIQAYCGRGKFDLATKRQVGSTAKPFAVYAPAIQEKQLTEASLILDEATNFNGYQPHNYGDKYRGWMTAKDAVKYSSNICAVKTLNALGVKKSCQYIKKMGLNISEDQNLSMALGNINGGLNCSELLQSYQVLANNGICVNTSFIKCIKNEKGTIYSHSNSGKKVFDSSTAFIVSDMLTATVKSGTAKSLATLPYQVCAKTGTVGNNSGNTDALVAGYTSKHTFVVWLGGRNTMENSVTGGTAPTILASEMLKNIYKNSKPNDIAIPKGIVKKYIDNVMLAQNNKLLIANQNIPSSEKTEYYFTINNCPNEISKRNLEKEYTIEVITEKNKVVITSPFAKNYTLKVYKIGKEQKTEITQENNLFVDYDILPNASYTYYAEFYDKDVLIGKSKLYTVTIQSYNQSNTENPTPPEETTEPTPNPSDKTPTDKDKENIWDKLIDWFYLNKH